MAMEQDVVHAHAIMQTKISVDVMKVSSELAQAAVYARHATRMQPSLAIVLKTVALTWLAVFVTLGTMGVERFVSHAKSAIQIRQHQGPVLQELLTASLAAANQVSLGTEQRALFVMQELMP